jgi:putative glutamine amidotransferase
MRASSCVIGISGCNAESDSVKAMMEKIQAASAIPLPLVDHEERSIEKDIDAIDALVVMGSDLDIDPTLYIERYPEGDSRRIVHEMTKNEMHCPKGSARAVYEEAMIQKALERGMPLLGICGGMQRINVLCGGTLHQHVPDLVGHDKLLQRVQGIPPHIPTLAVVIQNDTRLSMIARDIHMAFVSSDAKNMPKVIMENSLRHQSIDIVGQGLKICSLSDAIRKPDGTSTYLIEAIEADPTGPYGQQFLIGVQWHPEFGASPLGPKIVEHLVEAARAFAH